MINTYDFMSFCVFSLKKKKKSTNKTFIALILAKIKISKPQPMVELNTHKNTSMILRFNLKNIHL